MNRLPQCLAELIWLTLAWRTEHLHRLLNKSVLPYTLREVQYPIRV